MAVVDEQQFCLKWNNFQANITSQFETLRDDEDFTDVTIACDGQKLQAHKVVLSACSPFFKELFKTNPCPHPIVFMRDVEAQHITALMEFMYAGEVNIAQAHLSAFLRTAESLKIRGLTDTSPLPDLNKESAQKSKHKPDKFKHIPSSTVVTSSQDVPESLPTVSSPPPKRLCKSDAEKSNENADKDEAKNLLPKFENPDYFSDDGEEAREENDSRGFTGLYNASDYRELPGGMEIIPQNTGYTEKEGKYESNVLGTKFTRRRSTENWILDNTEHQSVLFEDSSDINSILQLRQEGEQRNRLIKLGEGIEIHEEQLRSVKWSDYRKLTRGLATILFSPAELATCSVTGQRWSRAGNGERPVKPALDRAKVQAIITYVANRFPMVEISRIKQVLAYKCKENSTAFKMKAVRYYGEQLHK